MSFNTFCVQTICLQALLSLISCALFRASPKTTAEGSIEFCWISVCAQRNMINCEMVWK